jgi:pimeloyl-ACP methyl ester carboxylesterase
MSAEKLDPQPFVVDGRLRGETIGEGPPVVLLHGITATRRQVVHGSNVLAREGYRMVPYDARGHGDSKPAPDATGYGSPQNVTDLRLVIEELVGDRPFVLGGSSMGSHTAVAYALESPEQIAGLVVIGPAYAGKINDPEERERVLGRWDALADGLEQGGVEGFLEVMDRQGLDPGWRETILRFTRERMLTHRYPDAVAQAMREVPRSPPFESMDELEFIDLPALVVASNDIADPGHPYAMAEAYAARLPRARMISEAEGESPLAWQGGRLSREIAAFSAEPAVAGRLEGS